MATADITTWMRVSEAARRLGVTLEMVRRWAASGRLTAVRTPYGHLVEPGSVERLAREREEQKQSRHREANR